MSPRANCALVIACSAALVLGCSCRNNKSAAVDASAAPATPAPTFNTAAPTREEKLDGATLAPERTFTAQVKATPDPKEADALAEALWRRGKTARVHRADLGAKGIWFRLTIGEWPTRALLEAEAPAMVASADVRSILGPVPDGEPAFVALEVPRMRQAGPALLLALEKLAHGRAPGPDASEAENLHAFIGADVAGRARAWVTGTADGQIHVLDDKGNAIETIAAPAPSCPTCAQARGHPRVILAYNVAGDAEPEMLVRVGEGDNRAAVWLVRRGKALEAVASVPIHVDEAHTMTAGEPNFHQLDSDADLELLWTGVKLVYFEGQSLCSAEAVAEAFDVERAGPARPMDARLHSANGVARRHGGAEEIRAFLKGTWERAPDLALDAALAYLGQAPDDAEVYRDVVARAEQASRDGKKSFQFKALLGLVAARGEWRAGLAPRLHDLIPDAIKQAQAHAGQGCDEAPLLNGPAAVKARSDPGPALAAASRRADPTKLSADVLAALVTAYPRGSPLADDVDAMMQLLDQYSPHLAGQARALVQQKRPAEIAPVNSPTNGAPPPSRTPPATPEPEPEAADEEEGP